MKKNQTDPLPSRVERETEHQGRKGNQGWRRDYAGDVAWLIHWAYPALKGTLANIVFQPCTSKRRNVINVRVT